MGYIQATDVMNYLCYTGRMPAETRRRLPVQILTFLTLLLIPFWLKLPDAPAPFTATYVLGFVAIWAAITTSAVWLLTGLPGIRDLLHDRLRLSWAFVLILLTAWVTLSQNWAFAAERQPGVAQNAALQMAIAAGFALAVASAGPPPRAIAGVMLINLLLHGTIGAAQVAAQGSLGLDVLGEFTLDPLRSGTSVIQAGDLRWLRPYGLMPHPNILAGMLLPGALIAAALSLKPGRWRILWLIVFAFAFWLLLLSFSRSAWLAFAISTMGVLPLALRISGLRRGLLLLCVTGIGLGIGFLALYSPLVLARGGVGQENTELRSIADRSVFNGIALAAIADHPLQGIGAGNYPWYSADYLWRYTEYDLRGDNVHHVPLSLWSELGIIGYGLHSLMLMLAVEAALRQQRRRPDLVQLALLATAAAFIIVGLFDHYPWTLPHAQLLWLALLATAMQPQRGGS